MSQRSLPIDKDNVAWGALRYLREHAVWSYVPDPEFQCARALVAKDGAQRSRRATLCGARVRTGAKERGALTCTWHVTHDWSEG